MRRIVALVFASLWGVSAAMAGVTTPKFELSVFASSWNGAASSASVYARGWSAGFLQGANERTLISVSRSDAFLEGVELTYYFLPALGVRLGAAYSSPGLTVTSDWSVDFNYEGRPRVSFDGMFPSLPGSMSSVLVSLNLVARWDLGKATLFGFAGPTLFFNSISAHSYSVYGSIYFAGPYHLPGEERVDFFMIPVRISETSWTGFGADFGAEVAVRIVSSLSLSVGARYYLCPAKSLSWSWVTGSYTSFVYYYFVDEPVTDLAAAQSLTTALTIKPSHLSVTAGIKIGL